MIWRMLLLTMEILSTSGVYNYTIYIINNYYTILHTSGTISLSLSLSLSLAILTGAK